jgi:hypothetical protein
MCSVSGWLNSDASWLTGDTGRREVEYPYARKCTISIPPLQRRGSLCSIGVPRSDKAGRLKQFANNFNFSAPVALFFAIDRAMREGLEG